jgi:hypothetical protein
MRHLRRDVRMQLSTPDHRVAPSQHIYLLQPAFLVESEKKLRFTTASKLGMSFPSEARLANW